MELLGSPVFIGALALLVLNDFVLKAAFHNWLTGKLSDFAGLVAFALFGCALWPERRRTIAAAVTLWFVYWKSPAAEGLLEAANHILPFAVGRTIDYTDLMALPAAWLACYVAPRLLPWPQRRWAIQGIAGVSFVAFAATSFAPSYSIREAAQLPRYQSHSERTIQELVDRLAARHDLACDPCAPISQGRLYTSRMLAAADWPYPFSLLALFDQERSTLFYQVTIDAVAGPPRTRYADELRSDMERELRAVFPQVTFAPIDRHKSLSTPLVMGLWRRNGDTYREAQAEVVRTLDIVGEVAATHGLTRDELATRLHALEPDEALFYRGPPYRPAIIVRVQSVLKNWDDPIVRVSFETPSSEFDPLQHALASDLEQRLKTEFGVDRVSCPIPDESCGLPSKFCHPQSVDWRKIRTAGSCPDISPGSTPD